MSGVAGGAGGLTQTIGGAPGAEGLLELLARGDQLRAEAGIEAKRAPVPPPTADDADMADAAVAEVLEDEAAGAAADVAGELGPADEDEERAQAAAAIDLTKANAATDRNVAPKLGKTYGSLREKARTDERELAADEVPTASPTGARLVTKPDGKEGVAEYTDGMTYDADGWHRPDRAASPPPAPVGAVVPPDLPAPPPPVADADKAATRQAREAAAPAATPGGSPQKRTFVDGSAVYADGSVYDPDSRSFRKARDTSGIKSDELAELLARAIPEETSVQPDLQTKGVGPDGAWDFDASPMLADAEDGFHDVGGLAYKEVGAQVIDVDKRRGIVTTLVSVTGIPDRVKDVIEAGSYSKTLTERKPRGVWSHKWEEPISKTLEIRELPPGDADLPKTMKGPGGQDVPWPAQAGALKVKTQFNLLGARGQQAFADVVFFDDEQQWSIGYQVPKGGARIDSKTGLRHIHELELYEYSPVLFGAMPHAVTLSVKSAQHAFRALDTIGMAELEHEDELRGAAGMETKAVRRAFVRDEDGKFAEVPGGGGSSGSAMGRGASGGGGTPSGEPAVTDDELDSWKAGPSGLPTRVLGDGTELRKTNRAGQLPQIAVLNPGGATRGRMQRLPMGPDKGKWMVSNARQRLGAVGTVESALELLSRQGSKEDGTDPEVQDLELPRNDEVGELQTKVAELEALVRSLAGQDEDELDPDLLLEQKAEGFTPCSQCGSTNADAYADGTGRCEDCGYPLTPTEQKSLQPGEVPVELPVHQHIEVAADEPATAGAPDPVGEPHAITDDASLDLVADDLARDDAPAALPVDEGTVVDGVEVKYDTSPVGTPGGRENWVDKAGGLPPFIRAVAHALIREGKPKGTAIAIAVSRIKAWAAGGGDVSAATRAKAIKTIAAWNAMKAGKEAQPAGLEQKALVPMGEFELLAARRLALEVD